MGSKDLKEHLLELERLIQADSKNNKKVSALIEKMKTEVQSDKEKQSTNSSFYQQIFEKAPIGIIHYNSEGVIDACNERFTKILGSTKERLFGVTIADVKNKRVRKAMYEALRGRVGKYEGKYTSITSGKTLPIRVEFHPELNEEGEWVGGIGMLEDISDRYDIRQKLVESKTQYRTIFEQNDSVMLMIDIEDGSIFDANAAALKFYGWSYEEITNMKMSDINILSQDQIREEMQKAKANNESLFSLNTASLMVLSKMLKCIQV